MSTEILAGHVMQLQYEDACGAELENAASGLCNAALHKLFPSNEFIVTGQYYFRIPQRKLCADYVVERIWSNGRRAIILVVEVKPHHQTEAQDAESDDQVEDYAHATLHLHDSQRTVYAAKFVGGQCMFYRLRRGQTTMTAVATDFMDIEDDHVSIRTCVATVKQTDLFR